MVFKNENSINNSNFVNSNIIQINVDGKNLNIDDNLIKNLFTYSKNLDLFFRLLNEKIEIGKKQLLLLNLSKVDSLVNTIEKYGFSSIDNKSQNIFAFYGYLISWRKKDKSSCKKYKAYITDTDFLSEIDILDTIKENAIIDTLTLKNCMLETQAIILFYYYERNDYEHIILLYKEMYFNMAILKVPFHANYLFALSCLNTGNPKKATEIFDIISKDSQDEKINFLTLCSKIINVIFTQNPFFEFLDQDMLYDMYIKLHSFEQTNIYKANLVLVAQIDLQSSIFLNKLNPKEIWQLLEKDIREVEETRISYIKALYNCNLFDEALKEIEEFNIYKNLEIDALHIICLLNLNRANDAENFYQSISYDTNASLDGLHLSIIEKSNYDIYLQDFHKFIKKYESNLIDFYYIAISVDDESLFDEEVMSRINLESIISSEDLLKMQYILCFIKHKKFELCLKILKTMEIKNINNFYANEIFINILNSPDSNEKEEIIDYFIDLNIKKIDFMKEKTNFLIRNNRKYAATLSCKNIFELEPTVENASNLISIMLSIPIRKIDEYKKYERIILDSKSPQYLANLALAYSICGYNKTAEDIIYKSLYYLNDRYDDFVFHAFLNIVLVLPELKEKYINENAFVVELKDNFRTFKLCFDYEDDLDQDNNHSFGIEHIKVSDIRRKQILGKKIGEMTTIGDKQYEISDIQSRDSFVFQYIIDKLNNSPKTPLLKIEINENEPQTFIKQIKEASDFLNQGRKPSDFHKKLLNFYLSLENDITIPIDCIALNDYSKYYSVIKELLYTKDFAFFAGEPNLQIKKNEYVLSLSTLILLYEFNCIDIINNNIECYCITDSLKDFIFHYKEKFDSKHSRETGSLIETPNNQMMFIPLDKTEGDMWNKIYEICNKIKIYNISNTERANFEIFPNYKAEKLFLSLNLHICQLDSLILAKRENKVFLSEDLFYRKIATFCKIENNNISYLVLSYNNIDADKAEQISLKISKSNYIFPPLVWNTKEGFKEITNNMLDGKIKKEQNFIILSRLIKAINRNQ